MVQHIMKDGCKVRAQAPAPCDYLHGESDDDPQRNTDVK